MWVVDRTVGQSAYRAGHHLPVPPCPCPPGESMTSPVTAIATHREAYRLCDVRVAFAARPSIASAGPAIY